MQALARKERNVQYRSERRNNLSFFFFQDYKSRKVSPLPPKRPEPPGVIEDHEMAPKGERGEYKGNVYCFSETCTVKIGIEACRSEQRYNNKGIIELDK